MPEVVRTASLEFVERSGQLASDMAQHLHREISELGGMDEELLRETRASCESNIAQSYRLMLSGRPAEEFAVTPEARDYVRTFVSRGITVPVLLRTYRLGHAWIWETWADLLRAEVDDMAELARAVEYSSRWMFSYIDLVSAALVEEFAAEQSQRVRTADQIRAATVRELLAGGNVDLEIASQRLGYELRQRHVALRAWSVGEEVNGLERAAREAAELLGARNPLILHSGATALDAWCGFEDWPDEAVFDRLATSQPPTGIRLAAGGGERGIEGFRAAREEATQAARIAAASKIDRPPVTLYTQVELVALLIADEERARRFVDRHLGALARDDDATARLRETVLAFLRCNGSSGRAAKQLFVHQNTITYRIHRAEELLDHPVFEGHAELLCALELAVNLGYGNGRPSQPS